jgi:hypothetical protein
METTMNNDKIVVVRRSVATSLFATWHLKPMLDKKVGERWGLLTWCGTAENGGGGY